MMNTMKLEYQCIDEPTRTTYVIKYTRNVKTVTTKKPSKDLKLKLLLNDVVKRFNNNWYSLIPFLKK